jgi:antitoxin MazE
MKAHFSKWGNSIALRIPKGLAEELQVFDGTAADIQIRRGALVVTPVDTGSAYDINALIDLITPENIHGETDTGGAVGNEIG